ncbi:MAG TPA: histidine phosphatase family protein [Bryobacteraceae bacterium]|nr:histidine phosphatase family protein [Bryobacteraceae bacterium]
MAHLTLIRHGQATAFEPVTDRLSPLGELQAKKLAEFWLRGGETFDEVYTGTLARQKRTEQIVAVEHCAAAVPWPEARVLPELDEYPAEAVIRHLAPVLAARDERFRQLVEADRKQGPDRNRRFQRMFEALMTGWVGGELAAQDVEPWSEFRERVRRGLKRITEAGGGGRRVAAFTSGGFIGVAVQLALSAPDRSGLEVNWRVRNCSLTGFLFSGGRLSLDTFNAIPHLDDPALRTFR